MALARREFDNDTVLVSNVEKGRFCRFGKGLDLISQQVPVLCEWVPTSFLFSVCVQLVCSTAVRNLDMFGLVL